MNTQRLVLFVTSIALFVAGFIFNSCGGDKNNGILIIHQESGTTSTDLDGQANTPNNTGSDSVAIYVTGERSKFKEMIATIERIELVNSGTGSTCEVLSFPSTLNFGDVDNQVLFLNVTDCPADFYDTIRVELVNSVDVTSVSPKTGLPVTMFCSFFVSYKHEQTSTGPLQCSGPLCSFELALAVNVPAPDGNKLVLGFNTSEFDIVNIDDPAACSLTMKALPFHYDDMQGYTEAITGLVSDLTLTDRRFSLVRVNSVFTVDYQQVSEERQPGFEAVLAFAENESLRVKVMTPDITSGTWISASGLFVKLAGNVSNLDLQARSFTVATQNQTIVVDYNAADIHGSLADGSLAAIRIYGYDGVNYLASKLDLGSSAPDG